jgi:hypothetical protein
LMAAASCTDVPPNFMTIIFRPQRSCSRNSFAGVENELHRFYSVEVLSLQSATAFIPQGRQKIEKVLLKKFLTYA